MFQILCISLLHVTDSKIRKTTPDVVYVVKMQGGISKAEAWMAVVKPLLPNGFVLVYFVNL